jgi:very-short-patch-repair endonuclease
LVAIIDDVNDDREAIVDAVRERQDKLHSSLSPQMAQMQYETAAQSIANAAESINAQHRALAKSLYRGQTWAHLVGRFLHLKRFFGDVPLRNILASHIFDFKEDGNELFETTSCLKRADTLYHQSKHLHDHLGPLHTSLFAEMAVGEAREKAHRYFEKVSNALPEIEKNCQNMLQAAEKWLADIFSALPTVVRNEFSPYRSVLEGVFEGGQPIPELLPLEQFIQESIRKLEIFQISATSLAQKYHAQLQIHYAAYGQAVLVSLTEYLNFTSENTLTYGPSFLRNDTLARFKTRVLSFLLPKHRQIRINRFAVRTRIAEIRMVQGVKPYIIHAYNDHEDVRHLGHYIRNIEELQSKVTDFHGAYPTEITNYVEKISETTLHPDFVHLRPNLIHLFNDFSELKSLLEKRCGLEIGGRPGHINSLQEQIAVLLEQLNQQAHCFAFVRNRYRHQENEHQKIISTLSDLVTTNNGQHIIPALFPAYKSLQEIISGLTAAKQQITDMQNSMSEFRTYHEWKNFLQKQSSQHQQLIGTFSQNQEANWGEAFECWYHFTLLTLHEPPNLPKDDYELQQFRQQKAAFNTAQVNSIQAKWTARQRQALQHFRDKGQTINSLFNKKGSKGMRRNSIRTIIGREFNLFSDFFPVLLVNPSVCSSILPLEEGLYDIVIFDEASQLRLEETYAALLRGKAKIVSGDKHQMAPSSYFQSGGALLDPVDEEGTDEDLTDDDRHAFNAAHRNLADSESLLAYAEDKGFKQQYLDIHYRSKHPFLIDFSNHAFYGMRLIPVPPQKEYVPMSFHQVDGIYEKQTNTNKAEALRVIDLLENHIVPFEDGQVPSVGVATFNLYQRNLILDEIGKRRQENPAFEAKMTQLGQSFFVKNLENIQGDERDIIILSTTFGKKENGLFSQTFGPIIQSKGHRMLNVIITRAKHKIYICTSFPQEYIAQYGTLLRTQRNRGRAVLYAYLMYAKAVSEENHDLRLSILQELSQHCMEKHYESVDSTEGSESPFEEEVYSTLSQHIDPTRIKQQHKVGGFRIDMVIYSKHTGKPFIAIECDGAKYHSSREAYAWDMFRQEQLEQYGFSFHRIWSTKWWDAPDKETNQLLNYIYAQDAKDIR